MKKTMVAALALALAGAMLGCSQKLVFDLQSTADNFGQSITYNNKVDIVWVLDDSASMTDHQLRLVQQVPSLIARLDSLKLDYRMVVVTTDMGYEGTGGQFIGEPAVLKVGHPQIVSLLQQRIALGESGNNFERGLDSLQEALELDRLELKTFLRQEALLVINVLSNEDDKSNNTKTSAPYARSYSNYLDQLKKPWSDGSRSWMMNFIGVLGTEGSACTTFQNYAEAGRAFIEMVELSGGVKESICTSSLTSAVDKLRARIVEVMTEYRLSRVPDLATLKVFINEQEILQNASNGWQYLSSRNSIKFYGNAVPPADAKIRVDFKPASAN